MLGGYPQISRIDLRGSSNFLAKLRRLDGSTQGKIPLAVDCGAGIGRVTEGCLLKTCEIVDIVEPVAKFANVIKEKKELGSKEVDGDSHVGDIFVLGLESWEPSKKYNMIWNQWCLGHLTDTQVVDYLRRCIEGLEDGGWICVKENLSTHSFGEDIYDALDSSVTRADQKFLDLFEEAGLKVVRGDLQTGFPKSLGLYPVKMYALRPR